MRREVIIAIILGVGLGVAVAFGIWRANIIFSSKKPIQTPANLANQNPVEAKPEVSNLLVSSPENNSVSEKDSVIIKGSANPKSIVAISTNADNQIVQTGADGSFEKEITLAAGPNELVVKSFDEQGNEETQKLTIVYSTEI